MIKLNKTASGMAILAGQIADGAATPVVGILSDKTKSRCGARTPWYIFGTITVFICYFGTFNDCLICGLFEEGSSRDTAMSVYFIVLPALFNIGWAAVQISNMALVVTITYSQNKRDRLISLRNGFTYISNVSSIVLILIMF